MRQPPADLALRLASASAQVLDPGRNLRLEDIAALTGTARATLYYYFSSRDELMAFLLRRHLAEAVDMLEAAASADGDPSARLRAVVSTLVAYLAEQVGVCAGLLNFAGASGGIGELMAVKDLTRAAPRRFVRAVGVVCGQFAIGDASDAANAILGGAMIATLSRSPDLTGDPVAFQRALTDQLVRSVIAR